MVPRVPEFNAEFCATGDRLAFGVLEAVTPANHHLGLAAGTPHLSKGQSILTLLAKIRLNFPPLYNPRLHRKKWPAANSNSNDSNVSRIVNHIVRPLRPVYDNRIINHRPLYYPRPVFVSPKNINYRGGHPILSRRRASGNQKGRRPSHRGGINGPNFRPSRPSPLSKVTMAYQDDDSFPRQRPEEPKRRKKHHRHRPYHQAPLKPDLPPKATPAPSPRQSAPARLRAGAVFYINPALRHQGPGPPL